jgi:hypothetical protein
VFWSNECRVGCHPGTPNLAMPHKILVTATPDKSDLKDKSDIVDTLGKFLIGDRSNKSGCAGRAVSLVYPPGAGSLRHANRDNLRITISTGALDRDKSYRGRRWPPNLALTNQPPLDRDVAPNPQHATNAVLMGARTYDEFGADELGGFAARQQRL